MREVCPGKQGVSRGLRPNFLVLNKGATTSLSLFKHISSNKEQVCFLVWSGWGRELVRQMSAWS